jgi:hypothetical protein
MGATTTLKLANRYLDPRSLQDLGIAFWPPAFGANAVEQATMNRDNAASLAELIGCRFYVIASEHLGRANFTTYLLQEEPGRTNMSHEPRVRGWLGTTDNVHHEALGYYEVTGQSSTHLHLREVEEEGGNA